MGLTISDLARLYQKATGELLPFSEDDQTLLNAMERSWRENAMALKELRNKHYSVMDFINTYKETK